MQQGLWRFRSGVNPSCAGRVFAEDGIWMFRRFKGRDFDGYFVEGAAKSVSRAVCLFPHGLVRHLGLLRKELANHHCYQLTSGLPTGHARTRLAFSLC